MAGCEKSSSRVSPDRCAETESWRALFRYGISLYREGRYAEALAAFEELRQVYPEEGALAFPLGCCYVRVGRFSQARAMCTFLEERGDASAVGLRRRIARTEFKHASKRGAQDNPVDTAMLLKALDAERQPRQISVFVSGNYQEVDALLDVADAVQTPYNFAASRYGAKVRLRIMDRPSNQLARVHRRKGVIVSTHHIDELCAYAGMSKGQYLLASACVGMVQWRTLHRNPLLMPEDFHHGVSSQCVFATTEHCQDLALLIDEPQMCRSCREFYCCLGSEKEIFALMRFLDRLTDLNPSPSSSYTD